jgi:hypothetical protein
MGQTMKGHKTTRSVRMALAGTILCAGLLVLPGITMGRAAERQASQTDSFFIVSSVDAQKRQIVLKLPTEVTEVVEVTPATTYRDEAGKNLKFEDLRAGDTVYATLRRSTQGALVVVKIRRGPMTLEEMHARYLREE